MRNYSDNSPPLSTHYCAKAGTTDRETTKGAGVAVVVMVEDYDNTRLVRTSVCTWILIGLRAYWLK